MIKPSIDSVRVSEATRRDARGIPDKDETTSELAELVARRQQLKREKTSIDIRLAEIRKQNRTPDKSLFYILAKEKDELRLRVGQIDNELTSINERHTVLSREEFVNSPVAGKGVIELLATLRYRIDKMEVMLERILKAVERK